ncbi:MAG: hypothetical protein ACFFAJ_09440 [Candidatus Hodarchaeota archaeon]
MTGDELQIVYGLNDLISQYNLGSLNPHHIYDVLQPSIKKRPRGKTIKQLAESYFTLSEIEWNLHFFPEAFSISWIFLNLSVDKPDRFDSFLTAFIKPETYISRSSRFYLSREGSQKSLIGWMLIPQGFFYPFRNFIELGEEDKIFRIKECQQVIDFKHAVSYAFYTSDVWWNFQQNRFLNTAKKKYPLKYIEHSTLDKMIKTSRWETDWSFLDFSNINSVIETFCKYYGKIFSYEDLCRVAGSVKRN